MSWNFASYFPNPEGTGPLAQRHGVDLGRQGLWAMDFASGRWLGVDVIGRDRDAYRAEDILRFFRKLFSTYGLPRIGIILEKGAWKSKVIVGGQVPVEIDEEIGEAKAQEALLLSIEHEFGIQVRHCRNAKGKGHIETGFGYLQRTATTFIDSPTYGTWRGEFSRDAKLITAVQTGAKHPKEVGIPPMAEMSKLMENVAVYLNGEEKEGRNQADIPDLRWKAALEAKPPAPLPQAKIHVFFPVKTRATIRGGHVRVPSNGDSFSFAAPSVFAQIGSGRPVMVCFDPTEPSLRATILNYESSTELGKAGDFLCHAEHVEDAPGFLLKGANSDDNPGRRRAYNRSFSSYFVAFGVFGKKAVRAHEHRDGRGNVALVEHGEPALPLPGLARHGSDSEGSALIARARSRRPKTREEEDLEIARIERMEAEALARGDLDAF